MNCWINDFVRALDLRHIEQAHRTSNLLLSFAQETLQACLSAQILIWHCPERMLHFLRFAAPNALPLIFSTLLDVLQEVRRLHCELVLPHDVAQLHGTTRQAEVSIALGALKEEWLINHVIPLALGANGLILLKQVQLEFFPHLVLLLAVWQRILLLGVVKQVVNLL